MNLIKFSVWLAILVIFTIPILIVNELVPSSLSHLSDLTALFVLVVVVVEAIKGDSFIFPVKYTVFSVILILLVLFSAIVNQQSIGSLFLGIKSYMVYIPFFLLPFVAKFSPAQIVGWGKVFVWIGLIQFPIMFYQRFIQHADRMHNGDVVNGLMGISSFASIFLISILAVLMAFFLRKKMSVLMFVPLVFLLVLPTTINETKGSLVIIPMAFAVPMLANVILTGNVLRVLPLAILGCVAMFIFLEIFNQFERANFDSELSDIDLMAYTFNEKDMNIIERDSPVIGRLDVNKQKSVGRGNSFNAAYQLLSRDIGTVLFGKGLGNVTETSIEFLKGDYELFAHLNPTQTAATRIFWELGFFGLAMSCVILILLFGDAIAVYKEETVQGIFAHGWLGVLTIAVFALFYKDMIYATVLSSFFWFFSGCVCSQRLTMKERRMNES